MAQEEYAKEFGLAVDQLRKDQGVGVNELARSIGKSGAYLSYLLRGMQGPPLPEVTKAIARALNADEYWLLSVAGQLDPELHLRMLTIQRYVRHTNRDAAPSLIRKYAALLATFVEMLLSSEAEPDSKWSSADIDCYHRCLRQLFADEGLKSEARFAEMLYTTGRNWLRSIVPPMERSD